MLQSALPYPPRRACGEHLRIQNSELYSERFKVPFFCGDKIKVGGFEGMSRTIAVHKTKALALARAGGDVRRASLRHECV